MPSHSHFSILFGTLANGGSRLNPPLGEAAADDGFIPVVAVLQLLVVRATED